MNDSWLLENLKMSKNKSELFLEVSELFKLHFTGTKKPLVFDIGLSGGVDSMVLLHILSTLRNDIKLTINAIHINHNLSKNALTWQNFCKKQCKALKINFISKEIDISKDLKMGVEGAARKKRYEIFKDHQKGVLALAHHQDDQAETLLLQLFRGSGLKGLASMQLYDGEKKIWRPFLRIKKEKIKEFAKVFGIEFIDDESNNNLNFDRNFLRQKVLPLIQTRYPNISQTISRSADNIAEGLNLNETIAKDDAKKFLSDNHTVLSLSMLQEIPKERVLNLIRWWLARNNQPMPNKKTLSELFNQIISVKKDSMININISPLMTIRQYQDQIFLVEKKDKNIPYEIIWQGESELNLPDNSRILFKKKKGNGTILLKITAGALRIQNRIGGERFKPKVNQPTRTLKYLLQNSRIPPWEREDIPLFFSEDQLVIVPNFGIHYAFQAKENEVGWEVNWKK